MRTLVLGDLLCRNATNGGSKASRAVKKERETASTKCFIQIQEGGLQLQYWLLFCPRQNQDKPDQEKKKTEAVGKMAEWDENLALQEEGKLEEVVEENSELDLAIAKKPPTGLTNVVLNDRLFQKACKEEGITLGELREADELAAKIGKARKMHESGRSTLDEFNAKIFDMLGAGPEVIEDTLARYSKRHATLVQTILQRMSELKAEYEEDLPVPPQIVLPGLTAEEVFFSEHFRKACNLFNISLKDVCKFERTKADYARLKRLQSDERISTDEYAAKVEQLLGVPELRSEEVLSNLQKSQLKLIGKLLAATIDIKHKEFEAEKAAEEAKKKQDAYVAELRKQVTQKIAKERQKAEMLISRQRAELEKSLVRRGVEAAVREVVCLPCLVLACFSVS